MTTFTVNGEVRYSQAVLKTDILQFNTKSRLVLAPTPNDKGGSGVSHTLVIIAGQINIADHATITYDLDGSPGDPPELVYDPDTPAPNTMTVASSGLPGSSAGGEGSYPQALAGGPGGPGHTGDPGTDGEDAPELEIFVGKITQSFPDAITVNFKGQDGGKGGTGGNGGPGGNGQKGAASQASDSWYDGDECTREPGRGGDGGRGGNAGFPGRGGKGGNGGIIKVFAPTGTLPSAQTWVYINGGGKGGAVGAPGTPGNGGKGGAQGDHNDPCPSRPEYAGTDGPNGQSMADMDPTWTTDFAGKDGQNGDSVDFIQIDVVPT